MRCVSPLSHTTSSYRCNLRVFTRQYMLARYNKTYLRTECPKHVRKLNTGYTRADHN